MNLPKQICQKLRNNAIIDPMSPIILKVINVVLLPYLTKSPPNIQPKDMPTIALVVNIVEFKSIAYGSQFN